jgi:hypothetical protein
MTNLKNKPLLNSSKSRSTLVKQFAAPERSDSKPHAVPNIVGTEGVAFEQETLSTRRICCVARLQPINLFSDVDKVFVRNPH